jgi:hypothetical protein
MSILVAGAAALLLQGYLHIQVVGQEGPGVGGFVDQLCD